MYVKKVNQGSKYTNYLLIPKFIQFQNQIQPPELKCFRPADWRWIENSLFRGFYKNWVGEIPTLFTRILIRWKTW